MARQSRFEHLRRQFGHARASAARKAAEKRRRLQPPARSRIEFLEDRLVLSYDFSQIVSAFNTSVQQIEASDYLTTLATSKLGDNLDVPMVGPSLNQLLTPATAFTRSFNLVNDKLRESSSVTGLKTSLLDAGTDLLSIFQVWSSGSPVLSLQAEYAELVPEAGSNDLLRIHLIADLPAVGISAALSGLIGLDYLNDAKDVRLSANANAVTLTCDMTVDLTFGIDVQNGALGFFISDSSRVTFDSLGGSVDFNADMSIQHLLDVHMANATLEIDFTEVSFALSDADGKIRVNELADPSVAVGIATGNVDLSADFKALLKMNDNPLGGIEWSGAWNAHYEDGHTTLADPTLLLPTPTELLKLLGTSIVSARQSLRPTLESVLFLNDTLPVINQRVGDILGIDNTTLNLLLGPAGGSDPNFGDMTFAEIKDTLKNVYGITVHVENNYNWIHQLVKGELIDVLSFKSDNLGASIKVGVTTPFFVLPLVVVNIEAGLQASFGVRWNAYVGGGINTAGFYIDPRTQCNFSIFEQGGPYGEANVVGGLLGVGLDGGLEIAWNLRLGLQDPDPSDGKLYLDEFYTTGDIGQALQQIVNLRVTGDLAGYISGYIRILWVFKKEIFRDVWAQLCRFTDVSITPTLTNSLREQKLPNALVFDSVVVDGTLMLDGTEGDDFVTVRNVADVVYVDWIGRGRSVATGVNRVQFRGGGGADRFESISTLGLPFSLPIDAEGGNGSDTLIGGDGGDRLIGDDGDDSIVGNGGNDTIVGGSGLDYIEGGDANDNLDGGADDDELQGGAGSDLLLGGGGADLISGGAGVDHLIGDQGNDTLFGGDGGDNLEGGDDDDLILGELGNDSIQGGAGRDLLMGGSGADTLEGNAGGDYLAGEDGADSLIGGSGDDTLDGGNANDKLFGDDELLSGPDDGDDLLRGGDGADTLRGGAGDDTLSGGLGADCLFGEAGRDSLQLDFAGVTETAIDQLSGGIDQDGLAIAGTVRTEIRGGVPTLVADVDDYIEVVQIDANNFRAINRDPIGGAELASFLFRLDGSATGDIEFLSIDGLAGNDKLVVTTTTSVDGKTVQLNGGVGNDTLIGGGGRDSLVGGEGNDSLVSGANDDVLQGDAGDDTLDGGAGSDALYGAAGNDLLLGGAGRDVSYGGADNDRIEAGTDIVGDLMYGDDGTNSTAGGDDIILGSDGIDVIRGEGGADQLFGGGAQDFISGGAGADSIDGGSGRDMMLGDEGEDYISAGQPTTQASVPWYLTSIELIVQSSQYATKIAELAPHLQTAVNSIAAVESLGESNLNESQRDQLLRLRGERDALTAELVRLSNLQTALLLTVVDINPYQNVSVDLLDGGQGADVLRGSLNGDQLVGGAGNDTVLHSLGDDTLSGGSDEDVYAVEATENDDVIAMTLNDVGSGNLQAVVMLNGQTASTLSQMDVESIGVYALGGNDEIKIQFGNQAARKIFVDGGVGKDLIDARALQAAATLLGGVGDDTIYGSLADDLLDGGGDNDLLTGGAGNDTLLGGSGIDSLTGDDGNDFLDGGENADLLLGGTENDTLLGGDGDDSLDGGAGDDTVYGNGGNDSLFGAAGNDGLFGGDGDDYLVGNEGNDEIHGNAGRDLIQGGDGDDLLAGGSVLDRESVLASSLLDSGQDAVFGGIGNDTLIAGDGFDALFGEEGNDTFHSTSANHSFSGGSGYDQLSYQRLNRTEPVWVADRAMILNRTTVEPFFHQDLESIDILVTGDTPALLSRRNPEFRTFEGSVSRNGIFYDSGEAVWDEDTDYGPPDNATSPWTYWMHDYVNAYVLPWTARQWYVNDAIWDSPEIYGVAEQNAFALHPGASGKVAFITFRNITGTVADFQITGSLSHPSAAGDGVTIGLANQIAGTWEIGQQIYNTSVPVNITARANPEQSVYSIDVGYDGPLPGANNAADTMVAAVQVRAFDVPLPPNQAPVLAAVVDQAVLTGGTLNIQVVASDPDSGPSNLANETNRLVYWLDPSYLENSTAANPAPALGARINALSGEFKWQVPIEQKPGVYTFRVGVTDHGSDAAAAFYDIVVEVQTQLPIGPAMLPPIQIEEGQSAVLDAGVWSDPEGRSLTYSWDVNGDNVFGDATGAAPTLTWPQLVALGISDGTGGNYNVKVQVNDGDGGITTSSSVSLTVNNVAPTAGVSGSSSLARGASGNYTFTATDPSSVDQAAGFTFAIDWNGDGSDVQVVSGASGLVVAHTFTTVGARTIKVTATDKDGGVSNQATKAVSVSAVQVVSGDLVWTGSAAVDIVHFEQLNATTVRVTTTVDNGLSLGSSFVETFNNITGIVKGSGLAGDDTLDASLLTTTSTRLDGGTGNNTLYGGGANDTLIGGGSVGAKVNGPEGQQGNNVVVGGAGDDLIYGNAINGAEGKGGSNVLLGGAGNDTIYGNWTDGGEGGSYNILVGGTDTDTLYDYKVADGAEGKGSILIAGDSSLSVSNLQAVLSEWSSSHTYAARVANIAGTGSGTGSNGNVFLQAGSTVVNDAAIDHLWGSTGGGLNWFWYALAIDEINRAKAGETHAAF